MAESMNMDSGKSREDIWRLINQFREKIATLRKMMLVDELERMNEKGF